MTRQQIKPSTRELFLSQDRRIKIYFYTSNLIKFLHARTILQRYGLMLNHSKSRNEPYSEDYSKNKDQLLTRAIDEIRRSVGTEWLFFVEDTSIKIDALSSADKEVPGLAAKEWFADTTFEQLDQQLQQLNKGRAATINSSIALHVPRLRRPVIFQGYAYGTVAPTPPDFAENTQFPWLTPNSFNGWFIPNGSTKRLGEMSLDESLGYDFRVQALDSLVNRLEEYQAALELPPRAYARVARIEAMDQPSLFPHVGPVFVVVGRTCAGKSTFGHYISGNHSLQFVEASDIIATFQDEYAAGASDPFEFARRVLETKGPDVVAIKIIQLFSRGLEGGLVITGFRTMEEVEAIKKQYPQCRVIWVEASERTRFERYLKRARDDLATTLGKFRELDAKQSRFGLLRTAQDFADIRILNEGTLMDYQMVINAIATGQRIKEMPGVATNVHPRHRTDHNQLYHCLSALIEVGRPATCDEIQRITKARGHEIRHNNANKVLKHVPELVQRWELEGTRVRYEIQNPGRTYVRLMMERASTRPADAGAMASK